MRRELELARALSKSINSGQPAGHFVFRFPVKLRVTSGYVNKLFVLILVSVISITISPNCPFCLLTE